MAMKHNCYRNVCIVRVRPLCMRDVLVGPWTLCSLRVEPPALFGH